MLTYTHFQQCTHAFKTTSEYTCCLQGCTCYNTYTFQKVNGTASCVPALVDTYRSISITLLVVIPALVVFFVVLDAVGRLRRGSYEKFVLRWVKRKGPPGTHIMSSMQSEAYIVHVESAPCARYVHTIVISLDLLSMRVIA